MVIISDGDDEAEEAVMRLARVGLENAEGWLDGGIVAWCDGGHPVAITAQWIVSDLHEALGDVRVLDVRARGEYAAGHVPDAVNIPLNEVPGRTGEIDLSAPTAVLCEGGYRSSIAASVFERAGASDLRNILGGTAAWIRAGYETA